MTVIHHEGLMQVVCDSCGAASRRTYEETDFDILLADITAEGWRKVKRDGAWRHHCPRCAGVSQGRLL